MATSSTSGLDVGPFDPVPGLNTSCGRNAVAWSSDHRGFRRRARRTVARAAFSLVEITLAVGIMAFAFVAILGLVPVGLNNFHETKNVSVSSQISQQVFAQVQATAFPQLTGLMSDGTTTNPTIIAGSVTGTSFLRLPAPNSTAAAALFVRYYNDQGEEVTSGDPTCVYQANVRVMYGTPYVQPSSQSQSGGGAGEHDADHRAAPGRLCARKSNPGRGRSDHGPVYREDQKRHDEHRPDHHLRHVRRTESLSMKRLRQAGPPSAFTLVELLVSMTVLAILLLLLTQLTNALRSAIANTTAGIEQFRDARVAFETMTRRIGQATLNAYDDVNPGVANGTAASTASAYIRASELRFVTGDAGSLIVGSPYGQSKSPYPTDAVFFQAPLGFSSDSKNAGLAQILNTCGYFVQWGSDQSLRPPFLPQTLAYRWRFRLMELIEPSERLTVYNYTSGSDGATPMPKSNSWTYTNFDWFQIPLGTSSTSNQTSTPVHVLADNVIFLALLPTLAPENAQQNPGPGPDGTSIDIAPNYYYNTAYSSCTISPFSGTRLYNGDSLPYAQNQLPPLVYVLMIAVDDKSFARYATSISDPANSFPDLGQVGSLKDASYTTRAADVKTVTDKLIAARIGYRIFSAAVPLSRN